MSSPIYGPPAHNQLPGSNLLRDAFGKTLEVRRQITQMLLDRGRRGAAGQAPSLGRLAPVVVRRMSPSRPPDDEADALPDAQKRCGTYGRIAHFKRMEGKSAVFDCDPR